MALRGKPFRLSKPVPEVDYCDIPRYFKPDPYNGFKDDREWRRALNSRARYRALTCVSLALLDIHWQEKFAGLLHWPHFH